MTDIHLTVNRRDVSASVNPRTTLVDLLRDELDLTGTHVGCEQGACGACTVLVNGASIRSCLMLAVEADGSEVLTIEGLTDGRLHHLQEAFSTSHALQCGFCTPGMIMTALEFLDEGTSVNEAGIRDRIRGNLCRCTGYQNIVAAISAALDRDEGA